MTVATLGMKQTLIDFWASLPRYDAAHPVERLRAFGRNLTAEEAAQVGYAYAEVLPLLSSDPDLARYALDTAVELDLYEAVSGAITLVERLPLGWACLALASLLSNPSVPITSRDRALKAIEAAELDPVTQRRIRIRLDPYSEPEGDLEHLLKMQSWPGTVQGGKGKKLAPIVYVDRRGANPRDELVLAIELAARGASVRRVGRDVEPNRANPWFSATSPCVVWADAPVRASSAASPRFQWGRVVVTTGPLRPLQLSRLLNQINSALVGGQKLRPVSQEVALGDTHPLASDVLQLGAYDVSEMAFLSTVRKRAVYDLAKGLKPLSGDLARWSFDQLLAIRILEYFRTMHPRRLSVMSPQDVVRRLASVASRANVSRVGVTGDGSIFIDDDGEGWINFETGQAPFDQVVELDAVFQPFEIGGGYVPALLEPSPATTVHPARAFGTPVVSDTRVPARALALLAQRQGARAIDEHYPELPTRALIDALDVGQRILHAP